MHTVSFGVDGTNYKIDLTPDDAAALRQDLAPWVVHARATPPATVHQEDRPPNLEDQRRWW